MALRAPDIALDLGTTNTMVYVRKRGVLINEPTLLVTSASDRLNFKAVGQEAGMLLGRTTDALVTVHPLRDGAVEDFEATATLVRYFIRNAIGSNYLFSKPRVVVSVPVNLPEVSRKALIEAVRMGGCKKVYLVEKPLAAAIGSGLPVYEPVGSMVVDVGGGTTDIAVVSMGGIVTARSIQVGGHKMDEAIMNYLKSTSSLMIGERTAENVKIDLAAAIPMETNRKVRIRGRDSLSAHAMDVEFTAAQAYEAVKEPCMAIRDGIRWVLERTPPELAADVMRTGIHLTGGGSRLFGLDQYIGRELSLPVLQARQPEDCTITGLGHILDHQELMESLIRNNEQ